MRAGTRTAATMAVLCLLLLGGAVWGWSALTAPFPGKADAPICENTAVKKGAKVFPTQVVVSVYNAGERAGLAGRTMTMLTDRGFREGESGNAPRGGKKVPVVQVWTTHPHNPAVQLVARQLGPRHSVVKHKPLGAGVTVVVGDGFRGLGHKTRFVRARGNAEICSPPVE
ncbi:LytR C-terminal domain-containing protein [Nocardioides panaciterrulae]|uniref:LytR/CpsA/Psr regulator C-terminal domain-containing protein n=1 Tax=Nocardioides panaciterrulae TaxID=661492 RepID=A0A7Y9E9N8_9ACTN|nr:LytR C-terminal domain-containing protein [Nocardioides panaciterrulae]NYD43668.1 hypothetical protein [Nocardioides panaciterrulae]